MPPSITGLVASGVSAFRGERLILRDVSLAVPDGAAALLLGPNGAGKSTLLRLLAGLKRPDAGEILWRNQDVAEPGADLAYLGHLDALNLGLTVRENLAFPQADHRAIEPLGLTALLDVPVRFLSAGQRRRTALARLAGRGANLWLLDEPTLGLDTASVAALGTLFALHRSQGGTIIAATHLPLPLPNAQTIDLKPSPSGRGLGEGFE